MSQRLWPRMRPCVIACCARSPMRRTRGGARRARRRRPVNTRSRILRASSWLSRTISSERSPPRAVRPETVEDQALIEGVRATERLLEHTFSRFGIQKIDALGKPFDPTLHEAVMEVDDPSQPPGTVVRVAEDGYTIHDRLLRPARVLVAKRARTQHLSRRRTGPRPNSTLAEPSIRRERSRA